MNESSLPPSSSFSYLTDQQEQTLNSMMQADADESESQANELSLLIQGAILSDFSAASEGCIETTAEAAGVPASPFESILLYYPDHLKDGRISPLNEAEHKAWREQAGNTVSNAEENASKTDGDEGAPNKSTLPDDSHLIFVSADTPDHSNYYWKHRYLQSEMARTETRKAMIMLQMEEQRQLRIRLIEAEAELHIERTKALWNDLWAVEEAVSMNESETAANSDHDNEEDEGRGTSGKASPWTKEPSAVASTSNRPTSSELLSMGNQTTSNEPVHVNATRGSRLMTTSLESESLTSSFQLVDSTRSDDTMDAFLELLEWTESMKGTEAADQTLNLNETESTADVQAAEEGDGDVVNNTPPEAGTDLSSPREPSPQSDATKQEAKASLNKGSPDKEPEETCLAERLSTRNGGRNNQANKPPRVERRVTRSREKELQGESPTHENTEPVILSDEPVILATPQATKPRRRISMGGMTFTPLGAAKTDENAENTASAEMSPKRDTHKRKRRKTLRNSYQPPVLRKKTRNKP